MKFYKMYAENSVEDYAYPSEDIEALNEKQACFKSAFQHLDHEPVECDISEESGLEFADFITTSGIPLISARFRRLLDRLEVDNLFYKPVTLTCEELGRREQYYLALPPRINCLDMERSELEPDVEPSECIWPEMASWEATKVVILPADVGNYKIFKIAGVLNNDIFVTEEIKGAVEAEDLENVYFVKVE